eukprot:TRINITY_DN4786_c0_g1_i3.p1 TRINITY_DN4786_c0_g1~~TRINITY_DN4786_c0_g1_i3.p1  ORF type:complete len:179 (+),score=24.33 TRINITY_DN4786_c0_g1_i3:31-537(+)
MASCKTVCIVFLFSGFSTCSANCGNLTLSCTAKPYAGERRLAYYVWQLNSTSFVICDWPHNPDVALSFVGSDTPYYTADGVGCKKQKVTCKDGILTISWEIAFDDETGQEVISHLCNLTDRPTTTTTAMRANLTDRPTTTTTEMRANAALGNTRGSVFMILSALMFVT